MWIAVAMTGTAVAGGLDEKLQRAFTAPGSESDRAASALETTFGDRGESLFVVVAEAGPSQSPVATREELRGAARAVAEILPGGRAGSPQRADGSLVYSRISGAAHAAEVASRTPAARRLLSGAGEAELTLTGTAALEYDSRQVLGQDLTRAELIVIPIAALILALLLRTAVAILVPLLFALVVIPTSLGVVWVLADLTPMSIYVTNVVSLFGLALSLDYSLLVVSRLREERRRTADAGRALARVRQTAVRTAALSALAVATGLAVLCFIPLPFMRSMGVAGLVVPLVAAAACLTLLPALLAVLGDRIDRGPIPLPRWRGFREAVAARRPRAAAALGLLVLVPLALLASAIEVTGGDQGSLPRDTEAARGFEKLTATLGAGALSPFRVTVPAPRGGRRPSQVTALLTALRRDPEVARTPTPPAVTRRSPAPGIAEITFFGRHAPAAPDSVALVGRFRDRLAPAAAAGSRRALLGGETALGVDFVEATYDRFAWIVAAVIVVTFLVVLAAFRSLVLPVKAVVMNCLSVAASIGLLVLAVGWGWFGGADQVEAWVPAFLVAVLFGLSMDYHVFLVSRIREEWLRTGSTDAAVAAGFAGTAKVVGAAGAIMIVTFAAFMLSSFADLKKLGFGLSVGIALDLLLVRGLLVPAAMRLLGRWNWYMPGRGGVCVERSTATGKGER